MESSITVERFGHTWIAHPTGHDCLDRPDEHGESDHPTAAIRLLLKKNPDLA